MNIMHSTFWWQPCRQFNDMEEVCLWPLPPMFLQKKFLNKILNESNTCHKILKFMNTNVYSLENWLHSSEVCWDLLIRCCTRLSITSKEVIMPSCFIYLHHQYFYYLGFANTSFTSCVLKYEFPAIGSRPNPFHRRIIMYRICAKSIS